MKSLAQTYAQPMPLPSELPPAAAMLYGFVDATEAGYRQVRFDSTTYTLASGIYRADGLAAALDTAAGGAFSTTLNAGIWTLSTSPAKTFWSVDRLAVLLGLAERASVESPSATSFRSSRISPIAIPLAGYQVVRQRIEADDDRIGDRLERDMGYVWEGARVVTVRMTMHRWALDAWFFGWVQRGRVAVQGSDASPLSGSRPTGTIDGRVVSASLPRYQGDARMWGEVDLVLAVEEP